MGFNSGFKGLISKPEKGEWSSARPRYELIGEGRGLGGPRADLGLSEEDKIPLFLSGIEPQCVR